MEIAAAAREMRARLIPIAAPANAIDVCGTGGDGHHTLNVSTAVALVVAACEVPVAKHGNRAASSKAGAADTLEALGLDLDVAAQTAQRSLADLGICFLFAQKHHPALARLGPLRRSLGRRTIFNLMGPLANPAGVTRQLIGIARPAYVPIYARALAALGTEHAMVVSGDEGLDELSLAGGNDVAEIRDSETIAMRRISAADAGLAHHPVEAIRGGDPAHNAAAPARAPPGRTRPLSRRRAVQCRRRAHGRGRGGNAHRRRRGRRRGDRQGPCQCPAQLLDRLPMSTMLDTILATKAEEVARGKARTIAEYRAAASEVDVPSLRIKSDEEALMWYGAEGAFAGELRSFRAALSRKVLTGGYGLIAEIKKASPSKGLIRTDFDPPAHARAYEAGGAACLSVLTDERYFQGHADYLRAAKAACSLPVLRKDFMVDPWQCDEARHMGADAILIIVAALEDGQMAEIETAALDQGMEVLIEVHDEHELERALKLKSRLIGINNRDLRDFSVDLDRTARIAREAPSDCLLVAESGLSSKADLDQLADHGCAASSSANPSCASRTSRRRRAP